MIINHCNNYIDVASVGFIITPHFRGRLYQKTEKKGSDKNGRIKTNNSDGS